MLRHFYMWLCFGVSAAIIAVVWIYVFTKNFNGVAFSAAAKNPEIEKTFQEFENTIKGFRAVNDIYFKGRGAEARVELERDVTLQRLKEKLESATSTDH